MHVVPREEAVRARVEKLGMSETQQELAVQINNDPVFHAVFSELLGLSQTELAGALAALLMDKDREKAVVQVREIVEMIRRADSL